MCIQITYYRRTPALQKLEVDFQFSHPPEQGAAPNPPTYHGETKEAPPKGEADALLEKQKLPLVLYDHPCLFRTNALKALEQARRHWRVVLTTTSLTGVWSALAAKQGLTSRTLYRIASGVQVLPMDCGLPQTEAIEVRLFVSDRASPAALALRDCLDRLGVSRPEELPFTDKKQCSTILTHFKYFQSLAPESAFMAPSSGIWIPARDHEQPPGGGAGVGGRGALRRCGGSLESQTVLDQV